jgi:3-hydroxybutyryl-CoA dehydratase
MKKGKLMNELEIGEKVTLTKTITDADVRLFAKLSGDDNPLHLDEEYASTTRFKHRIAHGHYVASMFSTILGTQLPGEGCIYLSQEMKYVAPVYLNDTITATAEVTEKNIERNRVTISTISTNQDGNVVIKGHAVVIPVKDRE